jgi:hypothetical protein
LQTAVKYFYVFVKEQVNYIHLINNQKPITNYKKVFITTYCAAFLIFPMLYLFFWHFEGATLRT